MLTEGFGRVTELYTEIADGLDEESLHHRQGGTGNPIGALLWHLARVQDDHIADLAGQAQVWERFQERLGLDNGTDDVGYGHTSEQVDAVRIEDLDLRHEVTPLVPDVWQLSGRLRVADAFYVALAQRLGTRVLTLDARLARASNHAVLVES